LQLTFSHLNNSKKVGLILTLIFTVAVIGWASLDYGYWAVSIPLGLLSVIAAILYTEQALLFFGALAPLSINIEDLGGGFGLSLPTEPMYILLFVLMGLHWMKEKPFSLHLLKHPVILSVSLYLVWLWVSSMFSSMPVVSAKFALARTWYIVLFFYFCLHIFSNYQRIHFYLKAFVVCTMIMVTYTLIMHAQYGFSRSASYGISWPFFPDHGMYAAAIAYGFFSLLIYTFYVRQFRFPLGVSPVLLLVFGILVFAIVVSFTRATWLSLIVAAGAWLFTRLKIPFYWIIVAFLTVATVAVIKQDDIQYALEANKQGSSDELEGHVKSVSNISTDPSNLERINRWKCASRMVQERPIFGFGPGTYVFQYAPFQKSSELTLISTHSGDLGDAHSEYFSAMSEMGFPGAILWLSIVLTTLSSAFRIVYNNPNLKVRLTTYIVFLGLVAYHAHAVLNNYSQYDKLAVPLWAFTAIIVAFDLKTTKQLKSEKAIKE